MKTWNVVLTSHSNQERRLLREVAPFGEFQSSGFREVILGNVADLPAFLEDLRDRWEKQPFFRDMLSTVVPVRVMFSFALEDLMSRLERHLIPLAPEIGDRPFYVRLKRRGHKGEIHSQQVEQALDRFLLEKTAALGFSPVVDFTKAQIVVVVEIVHNQCGLGLITSEMQARYPFIRLK